MTAEEFGRIALSSFGSAEMVGMVVGGILAGAFIMYLHPAISGGAPMGYVTLVLILLGAVFCVSRGAALYFDTNNLWPRNVGFAMLWAIYCMSMAAGVTVRRRWVIA